MAGVLNDDNLDTSLIQKLNENSSIFEDIANENGLYFGSCDYREIFPKNQIYKVQNKVIAYFDKFNFKICFALLD